MKDKLSFNTFPDGRYRSNVWCYNDAAKLKEFDLANPPALIPTIDGRPLKSHLKLARPGGFSIPYLISMACVDLETPTTKQLVSYEVEQKDDALGPGTSIAKFKKILNSIFDENGVLTIPIQGHPVKLTCFKESRQFNVTIEDKYVNAPVDFSGEFGLKWLTGEANQENTARQSHEEKNLILQKMPRREVIKCKNAKKALEEKRLLVINHLSAINIEYKQHKEMFKEHNHAEWTLRLAHEMVTTFRYEQKKHKDYVHILNQTHTIEPLASNEAIVTKGKREIKRFLTELDYSFLDPEPQLPADDEQDVLIDVSGLEIKALKQILGSDYVHKAA